MITTDAAMRARLESAVDCLIAALDALDAPTEDAEDGADAEDGGDKEASLGWTDFEARYGAKAAAPDLEEEHDGAEPDADSEESDEPEAGGDDEPSLGAAEPLEPEPGAGGLSWGKWLRLTKAERAAAYDQSAWSSGPGNDAEADDVDHENVRTDPAKLAKARERYRSDRARRRMCMG